MQKSNFTKLLSGLILSMGALALSGCSSTPTDPEPHYSPSNNQPPAKKTVVKLETVSDTDKLSNISVDGKKVPLVINIPGVIMGGGDFTTHHGTTLNGVLIKNFAVSGSNYQYSKFGYLEDGVPNNQGLLFSQGILTKSMPMVGAVKYEGVALFVDDKNSTSTGDAHFDVDFAQKMVSGQLSKEEESYNKSQYQVTFNGKISGNKFNADNGNATGDKPGRVKVEGQFYGKDAQELGGVFYNADKTFKGAFGGIKK